MWLRRHNTGKLWVDMTITKLINNVLWDIWHHRNGVWHTPHNPPYRAKAIETLDQVIQEEMCNGKGILPELVWHYFDETVEDLWRKSNQYNNNWLFTIEVVRHYADAQITLEESEYIEETTIQSEQYFKSGWKLGDFRWWLLTTFSAYDFKMLHIFSCAVEFDIYEQDPLSSNPRPIYTHETHTVCCQLLTLVRTWI
jgi:hypothetical protein